MNPPQLFGAVFLVVGALVFILYMVRFISFFRLWSRARAAGAEISLPRLLSMRMRRADPDLIVNSRIMAVQSGLNVGYDELESHYLAGGSVERVLEALIAAREANIPLDFKKASAIDLAGRDVLAAARSSVDPVTKVHGGGVVE